MNRTSLALLVVLLVALSTARADLGPPDGKKWVPVTTVVEATDSFPDYAFFETSWSSTPGQPPPGDKSPSGTSRSVTLHFFVSGSSIEGTGARRSGSALYGVPASEAEKMPGWKEFAAEAAKKTPPASSTGSTSDEEKWFELARRVNAGKVPGAISIPLRKIEELPATDARNALTVQYRIARTPAGVAFVKSGEPEPTGDPGNSEPESRIPWRWVAAGGGAFAALVLGVLWLVLRQRRA